MQGYVRGAGGPEAVNEDLPDQVVAARGNRQRHLYRRRAVSLRHASDPTWQPIRCLEVAFEQASSDQLVQMESSQFDRDSSLFGRLLSGDGMAAATGEVVEASTDIVVEQCQRAE
jgi:hypothetical protein